MLYALSCCWGAGSYSEVAVLFVQANLLHMASWKLGVLGAFLVWLSELWVSKQVCVVHLEATLERLCRLTPFLVASDSSVLLLLLLLLLLIECSYACFQGGRCWRSRNPSAMPTTRCTIGPATGRPRATAPGAACSATTSPSKLQLCKQLSVACEIVLLHCWLQ